MKARAEGERWSKKAVDDIKATPDAPNPKDESQSRPKPEPDTIGLDFGAEGGDQLPREPVRRHETQARNFRITPMILDRYGYTDGCPGCNAKLAGKDPRGHSADCRARIEKEIVEGGLGMERLIERDLRRAEREELHKADEPNHEKRS